MPSPRDLDPKFKDVDVDTDITTDEPAVEVPMVLHREKYTENGVVMEREHGPMPLSEWPAYAEKNGF